MNVATYSLMPNFNVKQFRKEKEKFKNDLMVKSTWGGGGGGGGGEVELEGRYYKLNCPAVCKQEQIVQNSIYVGLGR